MPIEPLPMTIDIYANIALSMLNDIGVDEEVDGRKTD